MKAFARFLNLVLVFFVLAAAGGIAYGQTHDSPGTPAKGGTAEGKGTPGEMSHMSQEDMDKMMALATPGEPHKHMAKMVGNWKTKIKMWMGPGEPTLSEGTCSYEMALGGRYMKSKHTGDMGGMPFEGMGIDGYDNAKKEYFSIWFDNMSTGMMLLTGKATPDGKGLSYTGTSFDPMQMKDVKVREEIRWDTDTHYTFTMYMGMPGPDGTEQEMKIMEIAADKL